MPPNRPARAAFQSLEPRLTFDAGALDAAFGDGGVASIAADGADARLTDVAVTPDGRIVVTGTTRGDGTLNVARLRADGSLDPTFGAGGRATSQIGGDADVLAAAVQPDHRIVVVGRRGQQYFVLRYNTNGKHDRTFGDGGIVRRTFGQNVSEARDVVIHDDGSIVVAGNARQANGSTAAGLARFNSDGSIDERFGGNGTVVTKFGAPLSDAPSVFVNRIAVRDNLAANDIVLAGRSSTGALSPAAGDDGLAVMRLHGDGSIDPSFSNDGIALADFGASNEEATGVAIDSSGRPVVSVAGADAFAALRLRASGGRDTTFGANGLARASSTAGDTNDLLIDAEGAIVLAGMVGDVPRVARLLDTGAPDDDFGTSGLTAPLPFDAPADAVRVVESPDQSYAVGGTGSIGQAPVQFVLAKLFVAAGPAGRLVSAPELRAPQAGSYVFHVEWRESIGVNVVTIGDKDLRVTGPNGYIRSVRLVSPPTASVSNATARYKVAPPNNTNWRASDNGVYTIHALDRAVENLQGVGNPPGVLGTFRVNIA